MSRAASRFLADLGAALGIDVRPVAFTGTGMLAGPYPMTDLDALGFDEETRQAISPGLIEVTLSAYGWTGPWRGRRGFDTLVQNSAGLARVAHWLASGPGQGQPGRLARPTTRLRITDDHFFTFAYQTVEHMPQNGRDHGHLLREGEGCGHRVSEEWSSGMRRGGADRTRGTQPARGAAMAGES